MDLPLSPGQPALLAALEAAFDREGKVARAIEVLGPIAERDVLLLDADRGRREGELRAMGGRVRSVLGVDLRSVPLGETDVIVACWTGLGLGRAAAAPVLAGLTQPLRPGGRVVLVEDYGRDDLSHLFADPDREARSVLASERRGAMLPAGFKVRVLHCFWTFPDLPAAGALLTALFPATGPEVAARLRRPRIVHKVAVYHRTAD